MNIDMHDMTRAELYSSLKNRAPDLAIGMTRARREELEHLHQEAEARERIAVKPFPEKKPRRRTVKKTAPKAAAAGFNIKLTDEEQAALRASVRRMGLAVSQLETAGLSRSSLANLVYLVTGVDPTTAEKVLEALGKVAPAVLGETAQ